MNAWPIRHTRTVEVGEINVNSLVEIEHCASAYAGDKVRAIKADNVTAMKSSVAANVKLRVYIFFVYQFDCVSGLYGLAIVRWFF